MPNLSQYRLALKERKGEMARKQNSAKQMDWKVMMAGQQDSLRPLIRELLQQVMEAEMDETLEAEKGERTSNRVGYRSGYLRTDVRDSRGQVGIAGAAGQTRAVPDRDVRAGRFEHGR